MQQPGDHSLRTQGPPGASTMLQKESGRQGGRLMRSGVTSAPSHCVPAPGTVPGRGRVFQVSAEPPALPYLVPCILLETWGWSSRGPPKEELRPRSSEHTHSLPRLACP